MASRTGKTLVLAVLGLVLAVAAVGCDSGASNDVGQVPPAESNGTQTPATPPAASAPAAPAAPGAPLEPLSTPPERSLWALSPESYDPGVEITVEFEPYGIGPSSYGPSIVALVSAATPEAPGTRAPDLVGRNVVLIVGDVSVAVGGRYTGTVVTRAQDDRIVLVLQDAVPEPGP